MGVVLISLQSSVKPIAWRSSHLSRYQTEEVFALPCSLVNIPAVAWAGKMSECILFNPPKHILWSVTREALPARLKLMEDKVAGFESTALPTETAWVPVVPCLRRCFQMGGKAEFKLWFRVHLLFKVSSRLVGALKLQNPGHMLLPSAVKRGGSGSAMCKTALNQIIWWCGLIAARNRAGENFV